MSRALWAINRKCLLHKSRKLIHKRRPKSMQSYLPAKNAACGPRYSNYATRILHILLIIWMGMWAGSEWVLAWVIRQQVGQRQSEPAIPPKWKSNCFVFASVPFQGPQGIISAFQPTDSNVFIAFCKFLGVCGKKIVLIWPNNKRTLWWSQYLLLFSLSRKIIPLNLGNFMGFISLRSKALTENYIF